jgi:hypothetical protein
MPTKGEYFCASKKIENQFEGSWKPGKVYWKVEIPPENIQ